MSDTEMTWTDEELGYNYYSLIYFRPDGWYVAGDFPNGEEALEAGYKHDWGGTEWKAVSTDELPNILSDAALADYFDGDGGDDIEYP